MSLGMPPEAILRRYYPSPGSVQVSPLGRGNINDTFLVGYQNNRMILQRINGEVFPNPQCLIANLEQLSGHFKGLKKNATRRWEDPVLLPSTDGATAIEDDHGSLWRALSYIGNSTTFEHANSLLLAEQTGWALGYFHKRVAKLDSRTLTVALPNFHSLPAYLRQFQKAVAAMDQSTSPKVTFCLNSIRSREQQALALDRALQSGYLQMHTIHGDPKIANVLFDQDSHLAISLIDLDTVGPGLIQHDIGDCLRSVCNNLGEDGDPGKVFFDLDRCAATLRGYFQASDKLLGSRAKTFIYHGLQAICFELGLRFFTDYLNGGLYFKGSDPEIILAKAEVQFALLEDIVAKENAIQQMAVS